MFELLRLNKPSLPVMNQPPTGSTIQGRENATPTHQSNVVPKRGECNQVQERRRFRTTTPAIANIWDGENEMDHYPVPDHHNLNHIPRPRIDFPKFDYRNPKLWIRRLERYFMVTQTPVDLYLDYLTIHLFSKVGIWFEGYVNQLRGVF